MVGEQQQKQTKNKQTQTLSPEVGLWLMLTIKNGTNIFQIKEGNTD
jgi:hypothetical protein